MSDIPGKLKRAISGLLGNADKIWKLVYLSDQPGTHYKSYISVLGHVKMYVALSHKPNGKSLASEIHGKIKVVVLALYN